MLSVPYTLPNGQLFSDGFHVISVDWDNGSTRFHVDGQYIGLHQRRDAANWVFDHPFYMLLNLAMGGPSGVGPVPTSFTSAQMKIDYVRVYDRAPNAPPSCQGLADGSFCGNHGIISGDANSLYTCEKQQITTTQDCNGWCRTNPTGSDSCLSGVTPPSCASLADGSYCGGGPVGGDKSAIYKCVGRQVGRWAACPKGCEVNEPGAFDKCL